MTHKELYTLAGKLKDYKIRRYIESLVFSMKVKWDDIADFSLDGNFTTK